MVRTTIGGLLGGLALYVVGFLFWGTPLSALALSRTDAQAGADLQAAMARALTQSGTGVYVIPDPATAEGTVLFGKGPIATILFNSRGFPVTDGGALIGGLVLALIVGLLIAFALRAVAVDFGGRVRAGLLFVLIAILWMHVGQPIFNHAPWGYFIYLAISDFVGLSAAVLVAAKLMQGRDAAAGTGWATESAVH